MNTHYSQIKTKAVVVMEVAVVTAEAQQAAVAEAQCNDAKYYK
jgi:hypothetical protein